MSETGRPRGVPVCRVWPVSKARQLPSQGLIPRVMGLTDVGPLAHSDRGDGFGLCDEFLPSLAGGVDDGVLGFEDAVGEPRSLV
jgi:hypothetical protein